MSVARLLMKDKKSTRLNSNVSSQSNRSTILQAKLLPYYNSGKPEFKAGKRFKLRKHQISDIDFFKKRVSTSDVTSSVTYFTVHRKKVNHSAAPNV